MFSMQSMMCPSVHLTNGHLGIHSVLHSHTALSVASAALNQVLCYSYTTYIYILYIYMYIYKYITHTHTHKQAQRHTLACSHKTHTHCSWNLILVHSIYLRPPQWTEYRGQLLWFLWNGILVSDTSLSVYAYDDFISVTVCLTRPDLTQYLY